MFVPVVSCICTYTVDYRPSRVRLFCDEKDNTICRNAVNG
jgi:hypothetical protein